MLNGEMSFKKDTEKIVLLKVKGLIHIVKFRTKTHCIFLSSTSATSQSSSHHGGACMYQESQQTRHTEKIVYKNFQFF